MRRSLLRATVLVLVGLLVIYGGISWRLASSVTTAQRTPLEATPDSVGLAYESLTFAPREGEIALSGWYIPVEDSRGTIIIVHGVDSNRASQGIGILELSRRLADQGFSLFLFDLRAHGESGGDQMSAGYFEQQDLLGAFDELVRRGVPPERIGVLGFSLGGAVALLAAEQEPRLRAVVADSAFADITDLIVAETRNRTAFPGWLVPALIPGLRVVARVTYGIDVGAIAPVRAVERLDFPLLLIQGEADDRVPPEHGVRLRAASPHPDTRVWLVPGAGHTRSFKARPDEYAQRVAAYFEGRFRLR